MGSKEYGRASPRSQTLPLGPVSLPHSLRTRTLGQEAKTRLLRSRGGGCRRGTLRKPRSRFTEVSPRTL